MRILLGNDEVRSNRAGRTADCGGTFAANSLFLAMPHAVPRFPVLATAEDVAVIQAVATHAGIAAGQNGAQRQAFERTSSTMPVHIETATPRTLTDDGPGFPHGVDVGNVESDWTARQIRCGSIAGPLRVRCGPFNRGAMFWFGPRRQPMTRFGSRWQNPAPAPSIPVLAHAVQARLLIAECIPARTGVARVAAATGGHFLILRTVDPAGKMVFYG